MVHKGSDNEHSKHIREELEELAPTLSRLPKKERHQVSGMYFTTLSNKVLHRIEEENKPKPGPLQILERLVSQWISTRTAVAALSVLFVSIIGTHLYQAGQQVSTSEYSMDSLNYDELAFMLTSEDGNDLSLMLTDNDIADLDNEISYFGEDAELYDLYLNEIDETLIMEEWL